MIKMLLKVSARKRGRISQELPVCARLVIVTLLGAHGQERELTQTILLLHGLKMDRSLWKCPCLSTHYWYSLNNSNRVLAFWKGAVKCSESQPHPGEWGE